MIFGGVAITSIGAYASTLVDLNPWRAYADVITVKPAYDNRAVGRQYCHDETGMRLVSVPDEKRIAIVTFRHFTSGVPGSQIGDGNTESKIGQRCGTIYSNEKIRVGYDVTYLLDSKQGVVRMDRKPGNRIRIENGEPFLHRT